MSAPGWPEAATQVLHARREVLPQGIVPLHYELALAPDADALTFTGRVTITIDVTVPGPSVTLNASGLTFDHATLDGGPDARVALDPTSGRATLTFPTKITNGRHILSIGYHGAIGRTTIGFFAMDYSDSAGRHRTLATNFEPAAARELLPCWDEPGRKATFTVSADIPTESTAISNMPAEQVTPLSPSKNRVRFAVSPRMSTYLLFLGIGDFERVHQNVDGVDVGIVVKRGDTGKAAFALAQAANLLRYYNDYFGVPYPLPKLDLIAAPGEIEGGSMENWGAIFYSQNHLLFDPTRSTEQDRQKVFLVVSHEMAHQWFGDLVTMAWWDDLWLNEGFARWMQTYAADDLHPEWDTGLQAAEIYEDGRQADSVQSTHPVVQRVDTADQAMQSFDSITYNKGAAIINMLNAYVGREKFRDGVRRYMRAHAFSNTVDTDLWHVMQQAVGTPIVGIERDFARQEGVPLVRVTHTATAVNLAVSRFADDRTAISQFPPQHWRIPLAISPSGSSKSFILLRDKADLTAQSPLLVNAGQMGYVRVLYSTEMFDELVASARSFSAVDQLGLLNDAWAFAPSGDAPASNVLQLAAVIPADANSVVWKRIVDIFEELDYHYQISPQRDAFRQFALRMLGPLALQLRAHTPGKESSNVEILRSRLQETQARLGDPEVLEDARRRFDSGQGTPAQLRSAVDIVAAQADAPTFEALLSRAEKTADPLEKLHLFGALADVADPALARRMIDIVMSPRVPAGASANLITVLARRHPDLVWRELVARFDDPQLPLSKQQRWSAAAEIAGFSSDAQRIADLQAYEERSVPPEARKPFLGSIASIRRNQRIRASVLPAIDGWIQARNPGTPSG